MADAHSGRDMGDVTRGVFDHAWRRVPIQGTLNFRDIGGYPVEGGGVIAWRKLFRSDALHRVDDVGSGMLAELSLRTVLDLRTVAELLTAQSPLSDFADRGTRIVHLSLVGKDFSDVPAELDEVYLFFVDRCGPAIGAAIKHLASPGALPALVHCTAGKDRTGIVVALMLAALGVPDQVIAADYALSSRYLLAEQIAVIGQLIPDAGLSDEVIEEMMASPPEIILRALSRARDRDGSIADYLARYGVSESDMAALRVALVTAS